MPLSPLEIKKKEFTQKMRGADPEEVQAFLDRVSTEMGTMTIEKKELEDRLKTALERLEHYTSLEQTIERTLAAAQQTAVTMQDQAKRESELILRDSQIERTKLLNDARSEQNRIENEILRARTEYQSMIMRMRAAMEGFSSFIRSVEQDSAAASTSGIDVNSSISNY